MLALQLFGTARARFLDQPLVGFPNHKAHLLLCYLLLNRNHSHPREKLAAIFWGDYSTPTSLKYLRNSIWKIKQAFYSVNAPADEYLSLNNGSLSFSRSSRYWLDVETFEATVTRYQHLPGRQLTREQATQLEIAVELYTGDLLEGIYEDWCLCDREQLSLLHLNTLGKLMAFHEVNGTYQRGLACGERILTCDNTREKVHRRMMRLYWFAGDRDAALAQYGRCKQILLETLGVSPMEQTSQLYQQIKHSRRNPVNNPFHPSLSPLTGVDAIKSAQQPMAYALEQIHRLQATIETAKVELRHLEQVLGELLLNPSPGSDR